MSSRTNPNSGDEENWRRALRELQGLMSQYEGAGNEMAKNHLAGRIIEVMRRLGSIHPDRAVSLHWRERADAFNSADEGGKNKILADVGKGLLILLATPFVLVGAVLFAAGGIIYGAGIFLKGVGGLLTGGALD